uniref:Uncharacterized protein n=1 Tax=Caenorhabditis japonica TaxID=281687 RepID=A0A8R1IE88_CAEJA
MVQSQSARIHQEGGLACIVCARPHSSVDSLKKTLFEEWDKLPDEYLHATVEAYPRRLRDVMKAKGGRIE